MPAALEAVRGGYGVLQIARPGLIADRLLTDALDRRGRGVARVLGGRQLLQALASGRTPSYPVLALGAEVDLLHAASMLAVALADRRRRRAALTDALIAGSFAFGGVAAARAVARQHPAPEVPGGLARLREQWADRLARAFVPGYPPATTDPRLTARAERRLTHGPYHER